jgi:hypothetical protein
VSRVILNNVATPSVPAANKISLYYDTADDKVKAIDEFGFIRALDLDGWRDHPTIGNGEMEFWQRQAPGTLTTYSSIGGRVYTADRWFVSNENTSVQAIRGDTETAKETGLSIRYYGTFSKITTTGKFLIGQLLSSTVISSMRGAQVRLQFNLKTSASLRIRLGLIQLAAAGTVDVVPINAGAFVTAWGANTVDPTLGTNLAYVAPTANSADGGTISGNAMNCDCTTNWKRFSCVFTAPIDCHDLMLCIWTDSQFTAAQSVSFSESCIYDGPEVRTNFVAFPASVEYLRLQRYYAKSFPVAVAPAAALSLATAGYGETSTLAKGGSGTAQGSVIPIYWPVRMRGVPTVTLYTPVGAGAVVYRHTGTTPAVQGATAVLANSTTDQGCVVTATNEATVNPAVGDIVSVHYTADAEL